MEITPMVSMHGGGVLRDLQLVGSLLYLGVMTRPDIMASMSLLCMYMSDPSEDCFEAALGVLLYVSNTKDLK